MGREEMGEIREGDLVESADSRVTFVDEEERERILKTLDKQSFTARAALEVVQVGSLVNEESRQLLEGMFGPIFKTTREKWRVLSITPHTSGATVWIGPPELTIDDVPVFKHQLQPGEQRSERFAQCRPVDISNLRRVLDS